MIPFIYDSCNWEPDLRVREALKFAANDPNQMTVDECIELAEDESQRTCANVRTEKEKDDEV